MKKNLMIVCSSQFGYLIDTYYYAKHLKSEFNIKYICIDSNLPPIEESGVEVIPIKLEKKGILKWIEFLNKVRPYLSKNDIVFVKYFRFCSLLRSSIGKNKFILDIRTGSIDPSFLSRFIYNTTLKLESYFASHVNIISDSLASLLGIKKYSVVPLGSPTFNSKVKHFNGLRLLYVGTLSNRKIDDTITGLSEYVNRSKNHGVLSYDIIGDGPNCEVDKLKALVKELGLGDVIHVHGRIQHDQLEPFFEKCNLGVSYIPKTDYFHVQPVTKTLEYIANGMPVIGTSTMEQSKVLNSDNGILCEDTPDSFCQALFEFQKNKHTFNSDKVRISTTTDTWLSVTEKLKKTLSSIGNS